MDEREIAEQELAQSVKQIVKDRKRREEYRKLPKAIYRCFDCGEFSDGHAGTKSFMGSCPHCGIGLRMVWEFDGEPANRGYWPDDQEENNE